MSSVGNAYQHETLRSYLTTRAFNNDFFTYTQSQNATTYAYEYTLAANITGADSTTCPAGRFLRETGRKLLPGANGGVNTLMVGVYDPVTGFSGFIDPNSEAFTIMNTDKSANIETIVGGANSVSVFGLNPNGSTSDLANPVFTRGDVIALGGATITGNIVSSAGDITATAGDITATAGDITATVGSVLAGNTFGLTTGAGGTVTQLTNKGTGVTLSKSTGQITMNNATLNAAAAVNFLVTNTLCDANDFVALQVIGGVAGSVLDYRVVAVPAAGSFRIYVQNVSVNNLSDAIVIQYVLIKAVTA
jgi:hypothetical protein